MMKRTISLLVVCLFISLSVPAQENGQMMLIYDEVIKPGSMIKYVESSKQFFEMLVDHVPEAEWRTVMTDDLHFLYAIPIENYGMIDEMNQTMQEMAASAGAETFMKMMEEGGKNVDHVNSMVVLQRDDLSYHPETMIPDEEIGIIEYNFYYLKPGTEFAIESLARDYIALMKKKGVESGYTYVQLLLGQGMPAIAILVPARSPEHLASMNSSIQKKMGPEGEALQLESLELLRRFERKIGWVRPDLSSGAFRKAE